MQSLAARERQDVATILSKAAGSASQRWLARPKSWLIVASVLALAVLAWSFRGSSPAVRYVSEPATRGGLVVTVTATGSVQPTTKVDVSSELSGTVRKVLVDYNSTVKAGQTLAVLDVDKLTATRDSSAAKLVAAKAKVADADAAAVEKRRDLARKVALSSKNVLSTHDLDAAQAAHDRAVATAASARAEVLVAEAELRLNETNLAKANIVSPISGIVLKRSVDPGQTVASSLQAPILFSIAEDLRQMELQVDVDEADVGKVKVGQRATFGVDAYPDRKFPATIKDVRYASETIQGVVTYKAVLDIDNAEMLLRPGMTATAEIRVMEVADALLVSNQALRYAPPVSQSSNRSFLQRLIGGRPQFRSASQREQAGPSRTLWVLRDGKPAAVTVAIGVSDGKRTVIESGELKAGDAVIIEQVAAR